jgi:hypothetical protein
LASPTQLAAFELPWDGNGAGDTPAVFAAASSASGGWNGAALFVETAGSGLVAIGSSGRVRATLGTTVHRLGPASPHALDRLNTLEIDLAAADLALGSTSMSQLAMGANRALVGNEIVQFARAERVAGARLPICCEVAEEPNGQSRPIFPQSGSFSSTRHLRPSTHRSSATRLIQRLRRWVSPIPSR